MKIFVLTEQSPRRQPIEVARFLENVNREVNLVRSGMAMCQLPLSHFESALSAFEDATSPIMLPHSWSSIQQYLTPHNLSLLGICVDMLPEEKSVISLEEIEEILRLVKELREAAQSENIPVSLKTLMLHHVELIEKAIAAYPITGVKALREVVYIGLGELFDSKDEIKKCTEAEEVSKLVKVWKRISDVTDAALKVDKLIQVGQKVGDVIENIFQSLT